MPADGTDGLFCLSVEVKGVDAKRIKHAQNKPFSKVNDACFVAAKATLEVERVMRGPRTTSRLRTSQASRRHKPSIVLLVRHKGFCQGMSLILLQVSTALSVQTHPDTFEKAA